MSYPVDSFSHHFRPHSINTTQHHNQAHHNRFLKSKQTPKKSDNMKFLIKTFPLIALAFVSLTNVVAAAAIGDDGLTRISTEHGMVAVDINGTVISREQVSLAKTSLGKILLQLLFPHRLLYFGLRSIK